MAKPVKLSELSIEIAATLSEYSQDVTDAVKDKCKKAAKEAVSELKQTSPKRTEEYAKSWRAKVLYESNDDIRISVQNGKKSRLTHVLENGHVSKNGTQRVYGKVKAFPHIKEAETHVIEKLGNDVKVAIKQS